MSRNTKKVFKIFCEGTTEYNYFDGFRKNNRLTLALRPVNMEGGGYANFLAQLRKDGKTNCLAKFILIDGDLAASTPGELKNLKDLIAYCRQQNKKKSIPHILMINCPDFEYAACLHSPEYTQQNYKQFLLSEFGYTGIDQFKADQKVYEKLNTKNCSYIVLFKKCQGKMAAVVNRFSVKS